MKFACVVAATSCVSGVLAAPTMALAQSVPPAIFTDPPADAAHPARMTVLHIPTHGLLINGLVFVFGGWDRQTGVNALRTRARGASTLPFAQ